MNNVYKLTLDIKRQQNVTIHRTVVGDTAVIFEIKVTDGGVPVLLDAALNKVIAVFERPDHAVYTQDKDTGVSFVDGTSTVTIAVSPASFRAGRNTIELQIYTREQSTDEVYPDLVTTEKGIFNARAATLRSDAPNAPSQLPMLEQLIADANASAAVLGIYALLAFGVYNLKLTDVTWDGADFSAEVEDGGLMRAAFDANKVFIVQLTDSDQGTRYVFFECYKDLTADEVFCKALGGGDMTVSITSVGAHINGSL